MWQIYVFFSYPRRIILSTEIRVPFPAVDDLMKGKVEKEAALIVGK